MTIRSVAAAALPSAVARGRGANPFDYGLQANGAASPPVVVVRSQCGLGTRLLQPSVGDAVCEPIEIEYRDVHRVARAGRGFFDEIAPAVPAFELPQRFTRDSQAPSPRRNPPVRRPEVHSQRPLFSLGRRSAPARLPEHRGSVCFPSINVTDRQASRSACQPDASGRKLFR
jgi:hypothetical protein